MTREKINVTLSADRESIKYKGDRAMQWLECTVPGGDDPEELCSALAALGLGGMSKERGRDVHG